MYGKFIAFVTVLILSFPNAAYAQSQEVNLGGALAPALGAVAQRLAYVLTKRPIMEPTEVDVPKGVSNITVNITNKHTDSSYVIIRIHKAPPPMQIIPRDSSKMAESTGRKKGNLISEADSSDSTVQYRDLSPHISGEVTTISLAPGETKAIEFSVNVGDQLPAGTYAAWIGAHVIVKEGYGLSSGSDSAVTKDITTGTALHTSGLRGLRIIPPGTEIISSVRILSVKE